MVFQSTLALCPACSCHVRGESVCPHCGEALSSGSDHTKKLRRSTAALAMGLAVAVSASGCLDELVDDDDRQGQLDGNGDGWDDDGWGNSVVATYGVAPSGGWGGNTGYGGDPGVGGDEGTGGDGAGGDGAGGDGAGGDTGMGGDNGTGGAGGGEQGAGGGLNPR